VLTIDHSLIVLKNNWDVCGANSQHTASTFRLVGILAAVTKRRLLTAGRVQSFPTCYNRKNLQWTPAPTVAADLENNLNNSK
jgi:hypothetical protein